LQIFFHFLHLANVSNNQIPIIFAVELIFQ